MRSCLLFMGVALALAALGLPTAVADWHTIRFPDRDRAPLGVIGGKVYVVDTHPKGEFYDWDLFSGGATTIRVFQPQEWKGWRLAYDPQGKDKAVFLARESGPGQDWKLTRTLVEGREARHTLQAAEGKLKGWYLEVAEKAEQVTDAKGRRYTAYRVFLSQKPKRLPNVLLTVIAP